MRRLTLFLVVLTIACGGSPTEPTATLDDGRWSDNSTCLFVTAASCSLHAGCGHGEFPRPTIRSNGTFDVDGTYRVEAGPVSIDPAPPAHFTGSITGHTLRLRVVPSTGAALIYTLQLDGGGCSPACV